jgi:hypothetical protein
MNLTKLTAAVLTTLTAVLLIGAPAQAARKATKEVWFKPGDQFLASMLWSFDSASGTGWKRSYQPSLTGWPLQRQTGFSYLRSGATYELSTYPYGGTQTITGLSYDASTDIWVVSNNGFRETWYGCASAGRPVYAQVAC